MASFREKIEAADRNRLKRESEAHARQASEADDAASAKKLAFATFNGILQPAINDFCSELRQAKRPASMRSDGNQIDDHAFLSVHTTDAAGHPAVISFSWAMGHYNKISVIQEIRGHTINSGDISLGSSKEIINSHLHNFLDRLL